MMSKRQELAQRLANKIQESKLTHPYGGSINQDLNAKGKPYRIGFSSPLYLDGELAVYGESFILFRFESVPMGKINTVAKSEDSAITLIDAIAKLDWDTVKRLVAINDAAAAKTKPTKRLARSLSLS